MSSKPYDFIVFGATSFVGQILVEYLQDHFKRYDQTLTWAIAGRSKQKLEFLINTLNLKVDHLVLDAGIEDDMQNLCAMTRSVVSTVGPYALYGENLVKQCALQGVDYCDLTGETQWIKQMIERYESTAIQTGARIVNCCGFDSIPSDLGLAFLQQTSNAKFGTPVSNTKMRVRTLKGGVSGGTVASLVNVVKEVSANPALKKTMLDPYSLCSEDHVFKQRQRFVNKPIYDRDFKSWVAPFVMAAINERIVHRSNELSGNGYGTDFLYNEGILTGDGFKGKIRAWSTALGLGSLMAAISIPLLRSLLERFVLPSPGEGPSKDAQQKGRFDMRFWGSLPNGQTLQTKFTGDRDPGYGSTAKMLGQAIICLASDYHQEGNKKDKAGGFWTTATMFDDRFSQRLKNYAGIGIEIVGE